MKATAALFSFAMVFTVACYSATTETGGTISSEVLSAIEHEALIVDVRTRLTSLLLQKIAKPALELSEAGRGILNAVGALLGAPPPDG